MSIKEMKTLTIGDSTYEIVDENARKKIIAKIDRKLILDLFESAVYINNGMKDTLLMLKASMLPIEIDNLIQGVITVNNDNNVFYLGEDNSNRATIFPFEQYLINGITYNFDFNLDNYLYGIQVFRLNNNGLTWTYDVEEGKTTKLDLGDKLLDTGFISGNYTYTPTEDNLILFVNFKRSDEANFDNYDEVLDNFNIDMYYKNSIEFDILIGVAISYVNGGLQMGGGSNGNPNASRATIVPIGQYLKSCRSYLFSFDETVAANYYYGVQVFQTTEAGLTFEPVIGSTIIQENGIYSRLVDTGWINSNYQYNCNNSNLILAVNFRRKDYLNLTEEDIVLLKEGFSIEGVMTL